MDVYNTIYWSFAAIASFDKRRREYKKLGWIYAARNDSFVDPVFKVGLSSRPPTVRVAELSTSTSVYRNFELVYFVHVRDRDSAEGQAHLALQDFRINPRKEFFQAPLPIIVQVLDRVASMFPVPMGRTPRAGFLEQPLKQRLMHCSRCGFANRVPYVLVKIRLACGACKERFTFDPGTA